MGFTFTRKGIIKKYFFPTWNWYDFKENALKGISGEPYVSFETIENLTDNPTSIDIYEGNGMNTTLGLGNLGLFYSNSTDTWKHPENGKGPFASNINLYNGYGLSLGTGYGFTRTPTYTWYPFGKLKF